MNSVVAVCGKWGYRMHFGARQAASALRADVPLLRTEHAVFFTMPKAHVLFLLGRPGGEGIDPQLHSMNNEKPGV